MKMKALLYIDFVPFSCFIFYYEMLTKKGFEIIIKANTRYIIDIKNFMSK